MPDPDPAPIDLAAEPETYVLLHGSGNPSALDYGGLLNLLGTRHGITLDCDLHPGARIGADGCPRCRAIHRARRARLCYVEEPRGGLARTAYFTTYGLAEQWGDGWDAAPYDCNAGRPYPEPGHAVYRVEFTGDFETPAGLGFETPFSVQDINAGVAAWLWRRVAQKRAEMIVVPAGITAAQFRTVVTAAGGAVGELRGGLDD